MIRLRLLAVLLLFAGVAVLCLQLSRRGAAPPAIRAHKSVESPVLTTAPAKGRPTHSSDAVTATVAPDDSIAPDPLPSPTPRTVPPPARAEPVPETTESATLPALTVLENMRTCIRQYAAAFGENPIGTNPEITSALAGQNARQIKFLKLDGNRVNGKGELVDTWGTPYFFHQISGHEMEIRCAGPDRLMYTADDLVTR